MTGSMVSNPGGNVVFGFVVKPETLRDKDASARLLAGGFTDLVVAAELPAELVRAFFDDHGLTPPRLWAYCRSDALSNVGADAPFFRELRAGWGEADFYVGAPPWRDPPPGVDLEHVSCDEAGAWFFHPNLATRLRYFARFTGLVDSSWIEERRIYLDNAWVMVPERYGLARFGAEWTASLVFLVELLRGSGWEVLGNVGAVRSRRRAPMDPALPIPRFSGVTVEARHLRADGPAWWLSTFQRLAARGCSRNVAWDFPMMLEGVVSRGVTDL